MCLISIILNTYYYCTRPSLVLRAQNIATAVLTDESRGLTGKSTQPLLRITYDVIIYAQPLKECLMVYDHLYFAHFIVHVGFLDNMLRQRHDLLSSSCKL